MFLWAICNYRCKPPEFTSKTLRVMKLTAILLLSACLQISARGIGQQVNLSVKNALLEKVFSEIEKQTGYRFIYAKTQLENAKKVNLDLRQVPLDDALKAVFREQALTYVIEKEFVIIRNKEETPAEVLPPLPPVTGTVVNQKGEPMEGVTVSVKGSKVATVTDRDGKYNIDAAPKSVLVFTFVGYKSQEITVSQTSHDIKMTEETKALEQVIVTGYGSQRRGDLTGSIAVVDMDKFNTASSGQITKGLQGMASGVTMNTDGQPGSSPMIRIRGVNTFGNNQPLYVIDGIPTQNVENLNPGDIASIQILKDASANSIYGARASNGVIIVTTKRGTGQGIQVAYNAHVAWELPLSGNVWNILSPMDMAIAKWTAMTNSGSNPRPDPQYGNGPDPVLPDYILPNGAMAGSVDESTYYLVPEFTGGEDQWKTFNQIVRANKAGTNWYDETFSPAFSTNHEISVSGRDKSGSYLLSFNHLTQNGTLMESFLKRTGIRVNTQFNVTSKFRVGENLYLTTFENPQLAPDWEGVNFGLESYRTEPIIPVYDIQGNFAGTRGLGLTGGGNEVATRYRTRNNRTRNYRIFGNAFAELDISENLKARTVVGGEVTTGSARNFSYPAYEGSNGAGVNSFTASSYSGFNWIWTTTLNFKKRLGDVHNIGILAGTEAYKNKGETLGGNTQTYYSFNPDFTNLSTGTGIRTNYSTNYHDALFSIFGRVDYSYDNKYILSGTLRRDGSSKFRNYQWGVFPAGSIGWRISQEKFMENIDWLSDLRLTFGYGVVGNQLNVDPNNPFTLYGIQDGSYYPLNGVSNTSGFAQRTVGNPDAKWEKNINGNIGINASLFNGKIRFISEYYWKDVRDLLFNPLLLGTAGAANAPFVNVANMRNQGLDASLSVDGTIAGDLKYSASVIFTTYQNKILTISGNTNYFGQEKRRGEDDIIRNQVGHAVSSFFGYQIDGFWDTQAEIDEANNKAPGGNYQTGIGLGRFRYADINNDGQITPDDRTFLGNPNPDYTYGINISLEYRKFDFNAFFYGSQGNEVWNQVKWWTDFYPSGGGGAKSHTALYESWTPDRTNAKVSRLESVANFSTQGVPNSYFVEDGSFFKLKNFQIGYTIPDNIIKRWKLSRLRFYVQGSNIFVITKYSGLDPEISFGGSTNFGIDEGGYRAGRQFLFGVNLGL